MIQIAVVEDEDLYAAQLMEFLDKFQAEFGHAIKTERFKDGDEIASGYKGNFDIILMDIEMKFMDGMTAAEEIRRLDQDVVIMFITNMIKYAIRGYQVGALDYVLKPVSYFDFSQKLLRAIEKLDRKGARNISVETPQGVRKLRIDDIFYIESAGHNLTIHTTGGNVILRGKMKDFEDKLSKEGFFRSNKGYLINMKYVDGVEGGNCLIAGEKLLISRARKGDFMAALTEYMS